MAEAFAWGLLGASSLVLGALLVSVRDPGSEALGLVMGFGAGVLFSAVSFELFEEAVATSTTGTAMGFFLGAVVFVSGDSLLARMGNGGRDASRPADPSQAGAAVPIVLGSVLDGIPESAVLGLTLLQSGSIGVAMLAAVFISNLPEAIAATSELLHGGWPRAKVLLMWISIALVSALAAGLGYFLLDGARASVLAFTLAFAGGAILAMLATSMIPEAYERAGRASGLLVTLGFAAAYAIHSLEA